uniref:Uncharacterized protein n=2 Tax=Anguilla anguilla TaxID=7936 RepID=A0A0E9SF04_ANGAN
MPPDQTRHTTSAASGCGSIDLQELVHFFFGSIRGRLPRIPLMPQSRLNLSPVFLQSEVGSVHSQELGQH